jgi:hypothetical protein
MALETFKAQLKAKAKTLGVTNLSNKRIDAYAATLEKQNPNLSTDDDHSEKVDAFLELVDIKQIAAFDDWQVTKARKDGKQDDKKDPEKKDDKTDVDPPPADDVPTWAKTLIESNKALSETVTKLQAKETKQTVQARLKETLKEIPATFYDEWAIPEKEEDFEPFTEKVKTKWEAFTKENPVQTSASSTSVTRTHKPGSGGGGAPDKVDDKELDAIIDKM